MNLAPILRLLIPEDYFIWLKYEEWRNHYETCKVCNITGWYEPDTDSLCRKGNKVFNKWDIATFSTKKNVTS